MKTDQPAQKCPVMTDQPALLCRLVQVITGHTCNFMEMLSPGSIGCDVVMISLYLQSSSWLKDTLNLQLTICKLLV